MYIIDFYYLEINCHKNKWKRSKIFPIFQLIYHKKWVNNYAYLLCILTLITLFQNYCTYIFFKVFIIFEKVVLRKLTGHYSPFLKFLSSIFYTIFIRHLPFESRCCPIGHAISGTVIILSGDIVPNCLVVVDSTRFLFTDDNDTTVIIVTAIVNNAIQNFILNIHRRIQSVSNASVHDGVFSNDAYDTNTFVGKTEMFCAAAFLLVVNHL